VGQGGTFSFKALDRFPRSAAFPRHAAKYVRARFCHARTGPVREMQMDFGIFGNVEPLLPAQECFFRQREHCVTGCLLNGDA